MLLAAMLILAAHPLHATLGETETQIAKRYGKPLAPPMGHTNRDMIEFFHYKDYEVSVTFIDGQSQRETFLRNDKKAIPEVEVQAILDANKDGTKWVMMNDTDSVRIWVLESKQAFAGYYKQEQPYFSVETRLMLQFEQELKAMQQNPPQPAAPAPAATAPAAPNPANQAQRP